jgi:hypothetical protein
MVAGSTRVEWLDAGEPEIIAEADFSHGLGPSLHLSAFCI